MSYYVVGEENPQISVVMICYSLNQLVQGLKSLTHENARETHLKTLGENMHSMCHKEPLGKAAHLVFKGLLESNLYQ